MRKFSIAAILVMLSFMMTVSLGCDGGKVDWEEIGQKAIKVALTQFVIPAYEQYVGDEDAVIAKVIAELEKSDLIDKYMRYVDVEAVLHDIYKAIDEKRYEVLRKSGYDTDAETKEPVTWYISATDFPELFE